MLGANVDDVSLVSFSHGHLARPMARIASTGCGLSLRLASYTSPTWANALRPGGSVA